MGHIAPKCGTKPAPANNNPGGGAFEEDQNHDILAYCLSKITPDRSSLRKILKIINLAAYITNLLFLRTKNPTERETKFFKFACL